MVKRKDSAKRRKGEGGREKDKKAEKEMTELRVKAEEYLNGWKRAQADYQNLKRDCEQRTQEMTKFANAALLLELLPIMDNFKKAFGHVPEKERDSDWITGMGHIRKQLQDLIEALGISEIKTVGEEFDPEKHEAVGQKKEESESDGTILEEASAGYMMHDRVLVPAKVIVNQKESPK